MRMMERNKTPFYYCLYLGSEDILDEYGNKTGEYKYLYSDPVMMKANISPSTGYSQVEVFGNYQAYAKVIQTSDMTCPIDENTVLFVDEEPSFDEEGQPLFNYTVRRVARSLNSISYAISEVEVS